MPMPSWPSNPGQFVDATRHVLRAMRTDRVVGHTSPEEMPVLVRMNPVDELPVGSGSRPSQPVVNRSGEVHLEEEQLLALRP